MSANEHRSKAGTEAVGVALITVSDSRTPETDKNKAYLEQQLTQHGHQVIAYHLVKDEPILIAAVLDEVTQNPTVQLVLMNGGTGISPRDTTYDVVAGMLEKTLPGFGELFRMISYEQIGAAAMMSRAIAGVYRQRFIVAMPGSTNAVQTAFEKLILPEINHLAWEITRTS